MQIRIHRFFFDGRDLFILLFGLLLIIHSILSLHIIPFLQNQSLMMLFLFLLTIRILVTQIKLNEYLAIGIAGILFSFVLSPVGMVGFLFTASLLHNKFFR